MVKVKKTCLPQIVVRPGELRIILGSKIVYIGLKDESVNVVTWPEARRRMRALGGALLRQDRKPHSV